MREFGRAVPVFRFTGTDTLPSPSKPLDESFKPKVY